MLIGSSHSLTVERWNRQPWVHPPTQTRPVLGPFPGQAQGIPMGIGAFGAAPQMIMIADADADASCQYRSRMARVG